MKKVILFAFLSLLVTNAEAQNQRESDSPKGAELLKEGIRKEKLHTPVKIADILKEESSSRRGYLKTTGSSIEKKLSTNPSNTDEGESFIAINPANPAQMVMSFMEDPLNGLRFPVYFSNDSGNTWTKSSFSTASVLSQDMPGGFLAGGGDPVLAYDQSGKLFFTWIYLGLTAGQDTVSEFMYWASSMDNGQTWTVAPGNARYIGQCNLDALFGSPLPGSDAFYDRQWLAVDRSSGPYAGRVYVSFLHIDLNTGVTGIYVKHFDPSTNSWSAGTPVYNGTGQFANVAVDNNGVLHVTCADLDFNQILHVSSTNGGQTFSSPHLIFQGHNLFGAQSSFTKVQDRENAAVSLTVDGANDLHVVWSDFDDFSTGGYSSFYSRSTNGGLTWDVPVNLSTMLPGNINGLMPVVSAYQNKVTIGTYGVDALTSSNFYTVTSTDNGATWDTASVISTQQTLFSNPTNVGRWFGDYSSAVRTQCKSYSIWSDGRGITGPKMYVALTRECDPLSVPELTPVNASFSIKALYPNPVSAEITINLNSDRNNKLNVEVYGMDGKIVKQMTQTINSGAQIISVNISELPAGSYMLQINSADGYRYSRHIQKI
jgi:hypothetical protein